MPDTFGGRVLTGGAEAGAAPLSTLIVSATRLNACAAVSLPSWIVETPAEPSAAAVVR